MALVLTNVYLEDAQRKALEKIAKKNRSNLSVEVRNAVDIYSAGMSLKDFRMLEEATLKAKADFDEMNTILDAGLVRAQKFFSAIEKLKVTT